MVQDRRSAEEKGELSEMDWQIIGASHCRIHIPLGPDRRMFELVHSEIKQAMMMAEVEMSRWDKPMVSRLTRVRQLYLRASQEIGLIAEQFGRKIRDGRPTDREREENNNGTGHGLSTGKNLQIVAGRNSK